MFTPSNSPRDPDSSLDSLDSLDRLAIGYLTLPLVLFLAGWCQLWVSLPLLACVAYSLKALVATRRRGPPRFPFISLQVTVAVSVACAWTLLGGADHVFFANSDWHVRDAVLHDLVMSPWPVGYGPYDGLESILRAPVAFYLPAALVGKMAGLSAAHLAMGLWTALGTSVFLIQVLSLTRPRLAVAVAVTAVIVFFSGLDIVGNLLNDGPRFRSDWNITTHLEWWAGKYQYSSMTTQLFWVPNHALCGWLLIGLLYRNSDNVAFDATLPICIVALALWSPLTAFGMLPFVLWKVVRSALDGRLGRLIRPAVWMPACCVGVVIAGYLVLDTGQVPRGMAVGARPGDFALDLLQQMQFFLLEAGIVGAAVLWIRWSSEVALALVVLALLPLVYLGGGNDLVMRASIPSLAVLAISAGRALGDSPPGARPSRKALLLGAILAVGAMTPVAEFARAALLPSWPINKEATLVGADCGGFSPSYVARLDGQPVDRLLRRPSRLALGPMGPVSCDNPALDLMWAAELR